MMEDAIVGIWQYSCKGKNVFYSIENVDGELRFNGGVESNIVCGVLKRSGRFFRVKLCGALGHFGVDFGEVRMIARCNTMVLNFKSGDSRAWGEDVLATKTVLHQGKRWSWGARAIEATGH